MALPCRVLVGVLRHSIGQKATIFQFCTRKSFIQAQTFPAQSRCLTLSALRPCQEKKSSAEDVENSTGATEESVGTESKELTRPVVDVQTSIRYLQSKAFQLAYGNSLVWEPYRRNYKGQRPPQKTRKTCIRRGVVTTGNPCPICRDEYLVLHPENVELLKQFISPYTGQVLSYEKTGLIDMPLPFRQYNYQEFYSQTSSTNNQ